MNRVWKVRAMGWLGAIVLFSPALRADDAPAGVVPSPGEKGRADAKRAAREARRDAPSAARRDDRALPASESEMQDVPADVEIPAQQWKRKVD